MKVNYRAEINLTLEEIKTLLHHQKNSTNRNKIQVLYWFKNGEVETITKAAKLLGVHRITVQRWWKQYKQGGLKNLLKHHQKTGRPTAIPSEVIKGIEQQLSREKEGFNSYKEIQQWVKNKYQLNVKYSTLHNQIYSRMKAKLKIPRPSSIKKNPQASSDFKKKLPSLIKAVEFLESTVEEPAPQGIKYWCEDETRLGLKTRESRRITALGIKPIGQVQWNFKAYYLYGAIAPQTGESFFLEFSHLDGDCFQIFLNELSQAFPHNLNVVQVDNGRFHHSSKLEIPENILLIFQPPYSPELNPIERVWQFLKQQLNWEIYQNLESLKERVGFIIEDLSPEIIRSLTGWDYILEALRIVA